MTCLWSKAQKTSAAALQLFAPASLHLQLEMEAEASQRCQCPSVQFTALGGHLGTEFNVQRLESDFFLIPICLTCQNIFPAGIAL